jgi:S-adenosylmethionine synthetase
VTSTSAEAGDDGQVGRGNRVNGLITPYRPMSLEAAAGKNPVSHVGKLYNVLATQIAEALVSTFQEVADARCLIVSKIGALVSTPALIRLGLATRNGLPPEQ